MVTLTFNYVVDAFRDIHQYCACFLLPILNFANMVLAAAKLPYSVFLAMSIMPVCQKRDRKRKRYRAYFALYMKFSKLTDTKKLPSFQTVD